MKKILFFTLLLSVFVGCSKDDDAIKVNQAKMDEQIILDYLATNSIDAQRDPSGLYYNIIKPGTGNVPSNASVTLLYKGYLTDGTVFDQTTDQAVTFNLAGLIKGWQIGLPKIGKGGKIHLYIPSALGYGSRTTGSIPANSVLIFEISVYNY